MMQMDLRMERCKENIARDYNINTYYYFLEKKKIGNNEYGRRNQNDKYL